MANVVQQSGYNQVFFQFRRVLPASGNEIGERGYVQRMRRAAAGVRLLAAYSVVQRAQKRDAFKPLKGLALEYWLVEAVLFDVRAPVTQCLFWGFFRFGYRGLEQAALLHDLCRALLFVFQVAEVISIAVFSQLFRLGQNLVNHF